MTITTPVPLTGEIRVNTDDLPWCPFPAISGADFKLLRIDEETGGMTILLRTDPGVQGPQHRHFGSVEFFHLKGQLPLENDETVPIGPNGYIYEPRGYAHSEPPVDEELITLAIIKGPIQAYDDDGKALPVLALDTFVRRWQRHVAESADK